MYSEFNRISELDSRKKLRCNECRRETIHTLEALCVGRWEDGPPNDVFGGTEYSLFRCGACDEVCFETSSWFSEHYDQDEHGDTYFVRDERQFPPPSSADFAFDVDFIPNELNALIDEMLYSLSGSKLRLATVALRMIIEFIVTDKDCAGRTLQKKIDDLRAKGHVDDTQLQLLHKIRKKGNAGAHERLAMTRIEMVAAISLINILLEKLYNGPARQEEAIKKANQAFK